MVELKYKGKYYFFLLVETKCVKAFKFLCLRIFGDWESVQHNILMVFVKYNCGNVHKYSTKLVWQNVCLNALD